MLLRNRFLGGVSPCALFAPDMEGGTPEAAPAITPAVTVEGPTNARAAATLLSDWREKQAKAAKEPPAAEPEKREQPRVNGRFAAAQQESPTQVEDAGPGDPVPSEAAQDDPVELPSIDPPRSWSKEDKELFASLPRETQERVSERERSRESDFLRRQSEATEKSKALEAKEQAAERARQQYETAAQNALRLLNNQIASEFADIKTHDDVIRLANEDPFRAIQFKARQDQLAALHHEVQVNEQARAKEKQDQFSTWSKEQDEKFSKKFPEFDDPEKGPKVRESVQSYLVKAVGVPAEILPKLWSEPLFRDAMFQEVIYHASQFHAGQQKVKNALEAPKPPVQRPGTPAPKGQQYQQEIAALEARQKTAKGVDALRVARDLTIAKRKAGALR
jgi:hypothetical protein